MDDLDGINAGDLIWSDYPRRDLTTPPQPEQSLDVSCGEGAWTDTQREFTPITRHSGSCARQFVPADGNSHNFTPLAFPSFPLYPDYENASINFQFPYFEFDSMSSTDSGVVDGGQGAERTCSYEPTHVCCASPDSTCYPSTPGAPVEEQSLSPQVENPVINRIERLPLQHYAAVGVLVPGGKKRNRCTFTTNQLEGMERVFTQEHYPTRDALHTMELDLRLSTDRIRTWFQNRRAKERKKSKASVEGSREYYPIDGHSTEQSNTDAQKLAQSVTPQRSTKSMAQQGVTGYIAPQEATVCMTPPQGVTESTTPQRALESTNSQRATAATAPQRAPQAMTPQRATVTPSEPRMSSTLSPNVTMSSDQMSLRITHGSLLTPELESSELIWGIVPSFTPPFTTQAMRHFTSQFTSGSFLIPNVDPFIGLPGKAVPLQYPNIAYGNNFASQGLTTPIAAASPAICISPINPYFVGSSASSISTVTPSQMWPLSYIPAPLLHYPAFLPVASEYRAYRNTGPNSYSTPQQQPPSQQYEVGNQSSTSSCSHNCSQQNPW